MPFAKIITVAIVIAGLSACGTPTPYTPSDAGSFMKSHGYSESDLGDGIWRVRFAGSRGTTVETVQTYWLYRCASLALEKGYQGFKLLSEVKFAAISRRDQMLIAVSDQTGTSYVPGWPEQLPEPTLEADIQLLKAPIIPILGKVFDAEALKAILQPLVTRPCEGGNVCHHPHSYVRSSKYRKEAVRDRFALKMFSL